MYDRTVKPIPEAPTKGLRARIETLVGLTGYRMAKYRSSWKEAIWSPFEVCWRPHVLSLLIFEVWDSYSLAFFEIMTNALQGAIFGFGIGINVRVVSSHDTFPDSYAGHDSRFPGYSVTRRTWPEPDIYSSHVCDANRAFYTR